MEDLPQRACQTPDRPIEALCLAFGKTSGKAEKTRNTERVADLWKAFPMSNGLPQACLGLPHGVRSAALGFREDFGEGRDGREDLRKMFPGLHGVCNKRRDRSATGFTIFPEGGMMRY